MILDRSVVFPSQFHVLDGCSVTPAFVPMAQRSLEQLTLSQAMDAALTQECAQPGPAIAAVAETKDPLDLGPSQTLLRIQSSMGQESQELHRTGDAQDSAKTTPFACMPKSPEEPWTSSKPRKTWTSLSRTQPRGKREHCLAVFSPR